MYSKLQELYGQRTEGVRASSLSKELAYKMVFMEDLNLLHLLLQAVLLAQKK